MRLITTTPDFPFLFKPMTTIQASNLSTAQLEAFELRQQDTGWGHAFAHWIPFYALIYACQRRTITPWACAFGGNIVTAFTLGFVVALANPQVTEKQLENLGTLALFATPAWVKLGINSARK